MTTRVITYTYDHLYGLTGANYSTGEQFQYAYDGVGNPVSTSLRGTNPTSTVLRGAGCRTVQTRTLTSTTVTTYTYDHANRLDYFYADGVLTDLDWDANPLRCAARTSPPRFTSGTSWQLAHPGHQRVYLGRRQVQGQILAEYEAGVWAYVLPDALGSVRQLVDATGQVSLAQSYDPFGVPFETSGSGESDFGYTGEWWGSYTDLAYHRARYYNPLTGGFLSKDPWPRTATHPKTLRGYMYAGSNPIMYTDASGLDYIREVDRYTCDDPNALGGYVLHFDKATGLVDWWPCIVDPANLLLNPNHYRDGTAVPIAWNTPGYPHPAAEGPRNHGWGPINSCSPLGPDDELWKYRPECWAPTPTMKEAAEQIRGAIGPLFSGWEGYVIGTSLSVGGPGLHFEPGNGCNANAMTGGVETVYDFVHQQRGTFSYSGVGGRFTTVFVSAGAVGYKGLLKGFSQSDSILAYEGTTLSAAVSMEISSADLAPEMPLLLSGSTSVNAIFSAAYNRATGRIAPIVGVYWGIGAEGGIALPELSLPVAAEAYVTDYRLVDNSVVNYSGASRDKRVRRTVGATKMAMEIGVQGMFSSIYAANLALIWANRY